MGGCLLSSSSKLLKKENSKKRTPIIQYQHALVKQQKQHHQELTCTTWTENDLTRGQVGLGAPGLTPRCMKIGKHRAFCESNDHLNNAKNKSKTNPRTSTTLLYENISNTCCCSNTSRNKPRTLVLCATHVLKIQKRTEVAFCN